MTFISSLLDFIGLSSLPSLPLSPADVYTVALVSFKTWPLLSPLLSKINAPHGRFSFDSLLNVPGNLSWFLMEVPSPIVFLLAVSSSPLSSARPRTGTSFFPPLESLISPSFSNFFALPSANQVLAVLYLTHYLHRAVLSPLRSPPRSPMHISVPLSALIFNVFNGFLMGSWVGGRTPWSSLPEAASSSALGTAVKLPQAAAKTGVFSWVSTKVSGSPALQNATVSAPGLISSDVWSSPLWYLGLAGWAIGFASNVYHDEILMNLRRPKKQAGKQSDEDKSVGKPNGPRYSIPYGGLYSLISYPNYLCEWFEWFSYSLAALHSLSLFSTHSFSSPTGVKDLVSTLLSTPPFLFAFVEVCVMLPRAVNGHEWYKRAFGDRYPKERKAVIPFVL